MFVTRLKNKERSYTNNVIKLEEIMNVPPIVAPQSPKGYA
jgi:hypothetical protein